MDLVLNNLHRLICHKTQTTNQPGGRERMTRILGELWVIRDEVKTVEHQTRRCMETKVYKPQFCECASKGA